MSGMSKRAEAERREPSSLSDGLCSHPAPLASLADQVATLEHEQGMGRGHSRFLRCSRKSRRSWWLWLRGTGYRVALVLFPWTSVSTPQDSVLPAEK